MNRRIRLTVNGEVVDATVEPRLQLADFLREHLFLTGTHLGCEHGVCGACTVEIDGAPARSCITYAVACEGAEVRTIEGLHDDPVMAELREAFSAEHALQCGYCTPGMLVSARDIVLRLPAADEARIRKELAGNLCRCTGYVGIVRAIQRVLANRRDSTERCVEEEHAALQGAATAMQGGDVERGFAEIRERDRSQEISLTQVSRERLGVRDVESRTAVSATERERVGRGSARATERGKEDTALRQSFTVSHPRETVWDFFGRLDQVTPCLPGASLVDMRGADRADINLRVKLGPIVAEFRGSAELERDAITYSGVIRGNARDTRSSSTTRGEIRYVLAEENAGAATRVDVDVYYTLTGTLAQFGRSGIVQEIAKRMTVAFAQNVQARLDAQSGKRGADRSPASGRADLNAGSLLASAVWARVKAFFRSLLRR